MTAATYNSITAKITSPEKHSYKYSSEEVIFPGWKIVAGYDKENKEYKYLLSLKEGKILEYKEIYSKVTLKDLKKLYRSKISSNVRKERNWSSFNIFQFNIKDSRKRLCK